MKNYTEPDILTALRTCGLTKGDTVIVHASLLHLGRMKGVSGTDLAARHFTALRDVLGVEGTIVVPTFTFAFCRGTAFDPLSSPSEKMGIFSEYVRALEGAYRSPHPMQSVAAVGPAAAAICSTETRSSFDPGGPFDRLVEMGAKGVLLGAPMQSFSLVHLAEERCAVPYRYWKEFTGPYGTPPTPRQFAMYVRDENQNPLLDLSCIEDALQDKNLIQTAPLGVGALKTFALRDFLDITIRELNDNPTWLLR